MNLPKLIEEASQGRWDEARIQKWYDNVPWLVGCNFTPSGAINQLEFWQADTFNPEEIDRELGWLAGIGMNTVRVFLHDLLWKQDAKGFVARIDRFLDIATKHGIRTMFVIFDSCWDPRPELGPQRAPKPGVHNSGWVQSPGSAIVKDPTAFDRLEEYVTGLVSHFRNDERIVIWDVWNEPNNATMDSVQIDTITQEEKENIIPPLLTKTFQWVRSAQPTQPLTCGIWIGDWSEEKMTGLNRLQVAGSDFVSFHRYTPLENVRESVEMLKRFRRPLVCTEYVARGEGNSFETILPYFKQEKIGAYNWGAVAGKTQTQYPWTSLRQAFTEEPVPWHHDIFRLDGSPYDPKETTLIRQLTGRGR